MMCIGKTSTSPKYYRNPSYPGCIIYSSGCIAKRSKRLHLAHRAHHYARHSSGSSFIWLVIYHQARQQDIRTRDRSRRMTLLRSLDCRLRPSWYELAYGSSLRLTTFFLYSYPCHPTLDFGRTRVDRSPARLACPRAFQIFRRKATIENIIFRRRVLKILNSSGSLCDLAIIAIMYVILNLTVCRCISSCRNLFSRTQLPPVHRSAFERRLAQGKDLLYLWRRTVGERFH